MPVELSDPENLLEAAGSAGSSSFEAVAIFVLDRLNRSTWELSVAFVSDDAMRALNRDWRGADRTTDVLSFSQIEGESIETGESPENERHLGDIVISVTKAQQQAAEGEWTVDEEISRLLLHGILHLLGYDHEVDAEQAERMRKMESETASAMIAAGLSCAREEI